jgi:hypothetical protein
MGMSGGGFASAATTPAKLSDNPDSPQEITLTHVIHNAYPRSNGKISYSVAWCDSQPLLSLSTSFKPLGGYLEFINNPRDENDDSYATSTVSFADYSFNAPGTYEFCIHESMRDLTGGIA